MPDFIKFLRYSLTQAVFLLNHSDIKWKHGIKDFDTGNTTFRGSYKCMAFVIIFAVKYPDNPLIEISGSFHMLKNNGEHNHNCFTFLELQQTAYSFCDKFQIDVNLWEVHQIEIGLNIQLLINPNRDLFERFIVLHGDGGAVMPATFESKQRKLFDVGIKFNPSSQYELKCYGKTSGLLRIESHIYKMKKLTCDGLKNLKLTHLIDFLLPENLKKLSEILIIQSFEKILIDEIIQQNETKHINIKHYNFYKEAMKFDFWRKLNPNDKRYRKKLINQLMSEHGNYSTKFEIIQELNREIEISLAVTQESTELLNKLKSLEYILPEKFKEVKFTLDYHTIEGNLMLNDDLTVSAVVLGQDFKEVKSESNDDVTVCFIGGRYCSEMNFKWYLMSLKRFLKGFDMFNGITNSNALNRIEIG